MRKPAGVGDWVERGLGGSLLPLTCMGRADGRLEAWPSSGEGPRMGWGGGGSAAGSLHRRPGWGHPGRVCRWTEKREAARDHVPGPRKLRVGRGGADRGAEVREEVGVLDGTVSPESTCRSPHPLGTGLGDGVFRRSSRLNAVMGLGPNPAGQGPHRKGRTPGVRARREGHVRMRREGGRRNPPCRHFDLGLPASGTVRRSLLLFTPRSQVSAAGPAGRDRREP